MDGVAGGKSVGIKGNLEGDICGEDLCYFCGGLLGLVGYFNYRRILWNKRFITESGWTKLQNSPMTITPWLKSTLSNTKDDPIYTN